MKLLHSKFTLLEKHCKKLSLILLPSVFMEMETGSGTIFCSFAYVEVPLEKPKKKGKNFKVKFPIIFFSSQYFVIKNFLQKSTRNV